MDIGNYPGTYTIAGKSIKIFLSKSAPNETWSFYGQLADDKHMSGTGMYTQANYAESFTWSAIKK